MKSAEVFFGLTFSMGLALSTQEWQQVQHDEERGLRAAGDNMTLAFVPLISLLANFLPRFLFNRLGTSSPTMVQQARLLGKQADSVRYLKCVEYNVEGLKENYIEGGHSGNEYSVCNKPGDEGLMWPDPEDNAHYYICSKAEQCDTTRQGPCFELRHQKCDLTSIFDFKEQQCLPKTQKQRSRKFQE